MSEEKEEEVKEVIDKTTIRVPHDTLWDYDIYLKKAGFPTRNAAIVHGMQRDLKEWKLEEKKGLIK